MIPPCPLAAAGAGPAVIPADATCTEVLGQVIADAVHDLAPSRWLIPDPASRRQVFPGYFRLLIEHALANGIVLTTPGRDGVALWLPAGDEPARQASGYDERLAAVTGPWAGRFRTFGQALDRRHPTGLTCHYLAILAVRPDRQRQRTGSALLRAHHAALDRDSIPAYLETADLRTRRLYLAHGYQPCAMIFLPGAVLYQMVRQPRSAGQTGQNSPGSLTVSAGPQPAPGPGRSTS
jgi:GNAT superfamily N-acetyltransferase